MTCRTEADYLQELDLFDFPLDNRSYNSRNSTPTVHNFASFNAETPSMHPTYCSQETFPSSVDDLGFPFDFDERDLLEALEFPKPLKLEPRFAMKKQTSKKRKLDVDYDTLSLKSKQKRTKWADEEVQTLWEGIATYGNNWRLIKKKAFGHRTYYQVKDKGRRILSSQGWTSGRTKATHDGASEGAKMIAEKVLALEKTKDEYDEDKESVSKTSVTSKVGSTGTPISSDFDFDLDFDCN